MYIKKVIIEGFRTYRNKTVLCLEPGLNVIIGRNGSGKSNLLCAIQFVLAYDFHQLSSRERLNLLHLSAGFRATSAFVEIIFNNEDRRLPEEGDEVSLRREITSAKDVFYINGSSITKEQVLNTLQSAGLSKVNPYYIIKQGKINDLATATDKKRLEQFTEIAGSLTWKELQPKNDSLLKDADARITQLEQIIAETENDLEALRKDEEQYQNWSETNTKKRALELLLGEKEKERLSSRIIHLNKNLEDAEHDLEFVVRDFLISKGNVTEADTRYKSYQADFRTAEEKLKSLKEYGEGLVIEHSKLELDLADRNNSIIENSEKLIEDLSLIESEISLNQNELSVICNDYNSAVQEEHEINTRLILNEQRRQQLFAKLGRGAFFSTIEERNRWIKEELSKIYSLVVQGEENLRCISEDMKKEESKAKELEVIIKRFEDEKVTSLESIRMLNRDHKQRLLLKQRRLQMSRNELWRKESEVRGQWKESHDKLEKLNSDFYNRRTCSLKHLDLILDKMRNEGPGTYAFEMASQYRGLVIDQFRCERDMACAIDAVGENKLFHGVVDTPEAANEILRWINREPYGNGIGLPGTFCFYPRNRLQTVLPLRAHNENEALPMMQLLQPVQGMKKVVENIFGRVLLCKSFDIALSTSRKLGINCVTLDGDKANGNGVLNGGFRNQNRSRSNIYFEIRDCKEVEKANLSCLQQVETQIKEMDCKCNEIASQLQLVENKISQTKLDILEEDLMKQRGAYSISKQAMEGKSLLARKLKMSLESNRAQLNMLEEELQQEFICEFGSAERAEVDVLHRDIDSAKKMLKNANAGRLELEGKKNLLESRLNDHLMRKKQDLERAIHEKSVCGLAQTEANQQTIRDMEDHLRKLESLLNENKNEVGVTENKIVELANSIVEARNEFDKLTVSLQKKEALVEKFQAISKKVSESISRNEAAIEVIDSTIVSIGTFEEGNEKNIIALYSDYNVKRLEKELDSVNDQLKRFENVNQKATVECASTNEKLQNLHDQLLRFRRGHENCWDLIANVESTKNDAVVYSFMQVARSFRSLFRTLVPRPGKGYLKWTYDDYNSESDDEDEPQIPDVDEITGVAVKVSFTGSSAVQNLNSLSGGQRSVVSLALVFAILMMDRAPFYLLDEADMALDDTFRSKVAAMVDKFSLKSQFVAITFRPELLEHAGNIIGVSFDAATQTSRADPITKEEAIDFVSSHGSASSGSNNNSRSTCSSDRTARL